MLEYVAAWLQKEMQSGLPRPSALGIANHACIRAQLIARLRDSLPAQRRVSTAPAPASPGGVVAQRTGGHGSKGSVSGKIHVQGSSANITHTINEDERTEFTRHINAVLAGDADIGNRLPFPTDTFEMFDECKDGLVLAKLINDSVPDTIDERVLNVAGRKTKSLNAFQMTENNNIVIESAKGIGCSVVNIGAGDIIEVREHLILGLIWQIIRRGLLGKIDIKLHPELYRLLDEDETLEQFLRLPPEQILLRWFNYHLKAANWPRRYDGPFLLPRLRSISLALLLMHVDSFALTMQRPFFSPLVKSLQLFRRCEGW